MGLGFYELRNTIISKSMANEKQQVEQYNDANVWLELIKTTQPTAHAFAASAWKMGANKIHPMLAEMPNYVDLRIGNWQLLPIYGKSSDFDFFNRMSKGIFNINARLRPMDRLELQIEPDLWHDLWAHTPLLMDEKLSLLMRSMASAAILSNDPKFIKQVGNLWWATFEFGGIMEENTARPYGAGILSSKKETIHFLTDGRSDYKNFDLTEIMETSDYAIKGYQKTYWIIDDFKQLEAAVIKLWNYLN